MPLSSTKIKQHEQAVDDFNRLVSMKCSEGMTRPEAIAWIASNIPSAHQKFLHGSQALKGVDPSQLGVTFTGDPRAELESLISQKMTVYGLPRHQAFARVMREKPELRHALVVTHNELNSRRTGLRNYIEANNLE